jgi:hypothetical protein
MITIISIILAAIFKAVCDKIQFHFSTSVFVNWGCFGILKKVGKQNGRTEIKRKGKRFLCHLLG